MSSKRLTQLILVALVLGIIVGYVVYAAFPDDRAAFAANVGLLPYAFLRMIKMIISPLVFATLVVGIGKMSDIATVGRIGGKALAWFLFASLVSLTLGMVLVNTLEPGKVMQLTLPDAAAPASGAAVSGAPAGVNSDMVTPKGFIEHLIPVSVIDAMTRNEILQIVFFAVFFGIAMTAMGERARSVLEVMDTTAHIMLKVTGYVMLAAPLGVFGALASTVADKGLAILGVYGVFMGEFYLGIVLLWVILLLLGGLVLGPRVLRLIRRVREPLMLAFSTASSEAAYPKTLQELERFGCSNRVASFVLPVGYSFNLDGSMMYCTFAVLFIAQLYGIDVPISDQIAMLAVLMLTSKGIAGVPRASLVVIALTLKQFGIPEAGLLLLLGIDQFLDMARSATNVVGNSVATAVVAKWEGELREEQPESDSTMANPAVTVPGSAHR